MGISFVIILKCLILGIIWAALLMPLFFKDFKPFKYLVTVLIIGVIVFFLAGYSYYINRMTIIALVALIISFIASAAVFERDSRNRSKTISFTSVVAAFAFLISEFIKLSIY